MTTLQVTTKDSILDELEGVQSRIAHRAYELFLGRNGFGNDPLADWLAAEQEVVWRPAIEIRENDDAVTVLAALPGVEPKDIEVEVTPQDVVIKAETEHSHSEEKGQIHRCEFTAGRAFRSVSLPRPIDVGKAKAELDNGMLRVTAPIAAEARAQRVEVSAA